MDNIKYHINCPEGILLNTKHSIRLCGGCHDKSIIEINTRHTDFHRHLKPRSKDKMLPDGSFFYRQETCSNCGFYCYEIIPVTTDLVNKLNLTILDKSIEEDEKV